MPSTKKPKLQPPARHSQQLRASPHRAANRPITQISFFCALCIPFCSHHSLARSSNPAYVQTFPALKKQNQDPPPCPTPPRHREGVSSAGRNDFWVWPIATHAFGRYHTTRGSSQSSVGTSYITRSWYTATLGHNVAMALRECAPKPTDAECASTRKPHEMMHLTG
jgi:hypothetical protein